MAETTRPAPPQLSPEEAAEIIREATALDAAGTATLTRDDLSAMARELGISEAAVERAIAARATRAEQKRKTRKGLLDVGRHLTSYVAVIGGLTVLDFMTGPGWWVQWPALGWGIGVASHVLAALRKLADDRLG